MGAKRCSHKNLFQDKLAVLVEKDTVDVFISAVENGADDCICSGHAEFGAGDIADRDAVVEIGWWAIAMIEFSAGRGWASAADSGVTVSDRRACSLPR